LAYEVERYDAQAQQAEIWVKLDSISNESSVLLTLHWGRLQAPNFSFGPGVFSSYGGVWHLNEVPGIAGDGEALDVSPNAGRLSGPLETGDRSGSIGKGAGFRGQNYLVGSGHAGIWPETTFTLSSWIKISDPLTTGAGILSLGDNYILRLEPTGTVRLFYYNDTLTNSDPLAGPWVDATTLQRVDDFLWHNVAGVLAQDSLRIYIDGKQSAAVHARGPVTYLRGTELYIGVHGGLESDFHFNGQIDEVQISGYSRSAAWMSLAYETQKPGSTAITFR
jgi:hypothetical protein